MLDVTFEVGGRRVRPNQMGDALEKVLLEQISASVANSLRNVRCRVHGGRPRVRCKGRTASQLSFEIHGCCDDLVSEATRKLS